MKHAYRAIVAAVSVVLVLEIYARTSSSSVPELTPDVLDAAVAPSDAASDAAHAKRKPAYAPGDYRHFLAIGNMLIPTTDGGVMADTINRPCHVGCVSIYQMALTSAQQQFEGPVGENGQELVEQIHACLRGCASTGGDAFHWPPAE